MVINISKPFYGEELLLGSEDPKFREAYGRFIKCPERMLFDQMTDLTEWAKKLGTDLAFKILI